MSVYQDPPPPSAYEDSVAEADVERLAGIIRDARDAGIRHGDFTLARWILERWPRSEPRKT